ncbi:MAG TPA: PadR family transcriptional regulator [Solirubrobacteraceae bacterium]|nr:PadR family transcriptional regulator [Solirubrobacteraceae bacterium]
MHREHHHHHRGPGGGPGPRGAFAFAPGGFGAGFGPGGFGPGGFGGGPRWRGGRKARRGDIRTAALLLLAEEPRNGYQIMQEVQERSEGAWSPSPGSVYPALQQLEDEGLIRSEELDGRKLYRLTVEGLAKVEQRDEGQPAPWEQMSGGLRPPMVELAKAMRELAAAFTQIMHGSDSQIAAAREVLVRARRDLYRILADGEDGADARGNAEGSSEGDR